MKHPTFTPWLILLAVTDLVFAFLTWIVRPDAFLNILLFILLFSSMAAFVGLYLERTRRKKISRALESFLETPDERSKNLLIQEVGEPWRENVEAVYQSLDLARASLSEKTGELAAYQEFIEAWVHEIKTPLSLSTLVLNNHQDEMSPYVFTRLRYVEQQVSEDVARILFYARLQTDHADYKFTRFDLDACVREVLAEHQTIIDEKKVQVYLALKALTVISDRKVVCFMLSQLIDNAVKYADSSDGKVSISLEQKSDQVCFGIYNNGEGVPPEDAPFIFDKGFTGNHPNRQKATGMGLYLVDKYAEKLKVTVRLDPKIPYKTGFGIQMIFTE